MTALDRPQREAGFTLIELLISIVLVGVIVLITGAAMQIGARSVAAGERKAESLERLRTSLRVMDAHIQSAFFKRRTDLEAAPGPRLPRPGQRTPSPDEPEEKAPTAGVEFAGERGLLQFPSHYSLWGDGGGAVTVTYRVEAAEGGRKALMLSEEHPVTGMVREALLIDGARDISFELFKKGVADEKGEWVEEWDDEETIPEKIRVTVEFDRFKSSSIVPLRAARQTGIVVAAGGQ